MGKVLYLVFGHSALQNYEDLEDLCDNIKFFNPNSEIIINHPFVDHPFVKTKTLVREIDTSRHTFSVVVSFLKYIQENKPDFDFICLYSANQYMINKFDLEIDTNYVQFMNHENWESVYTGKDFPNEIFGNPFQGIQVGTSKTRNEIYDFKNYYKDLGISIPMCNNWDFCHFTKKTVDLALKHLDQVCQVYPEGSYGCDRSMTFLGYMALISGQKWKFPPLLYSSANISNQETHFCTIPQILDSHKNGYSCVKRVNYNKDCHLKQFIRNNLMK